MKVEQIYTGCLAQGAYYIQSQNEAVIIDPLREIDSYIEIAEENGAEITYIFETHFHADFVSGHVDLARKTGAKIVFGPTAKTEFESHTAFDGEVFKFGKASIKVLHTPGHTMESSTYLLIDERGRDHAIFSGDTLFIGDVGRPDLAVQSSLTKEDLAGYLYDSLRDKIMPLPDHILVYPAHGAGSACGKNMSDKTWDTLGGQKQTNYALSRKLSKEDFIDKVTEGILPPPQYFAKNAQLNIAGYKSFDHVLAKGLVPLHVASFEAVANDPGVLVLDTRHPDEYVASHIPNSIFIGLNGSFAVWAGSLIADLDQPIIFIANEGREEEVLTRLARVGCDNTLGYLKGGMEAWVAAEKETHKIPCITADELEKRLIPGQTRILDVRKPGEYEKAHMEDAINFPLDFINVETIQNHVDEEIYVHCASGYRSVIAASILKSRGVANIVNIDRGFQGICDTNIRRVSTPCASEVMP